jgi:hypothetical protein
MQASLPDPQAQYTAFAGTTRIAAGFLPEVASGVRRHLDADEAAQVLVFADADARPVDLDLRGSVADVLARLQPIESEHSHEGRGEGNGARLADGAADPGPRGPGRPKLGVVAREVTLLPRHWDWLAGQPGGASVALRKLVDAARKQGLHTEQVRGAREAAYRFMSAMAGNLPGFEEATRALFAGDSAGFAARMEAWPADVREYAGKLAAPSFAPADASAAAQEV